ncbi:MAG: carnitine dehydratase [Gammaproteobacteria bacterium]|nr:carnitine dehydratase [Gammaproteobacteria bacterium]|tara:strand:+ start:316 stop:1416 length:1101 start_codon:yes stop_codon:yes gene_type:complete
MNGPLHGIKIIEMAAIGPVPFCGMMLADMGADIVRIDRLGSPVAHQDNPVNRGRRSIALDLKQPADLAIARSLIARADALLEGFRPGVMERLGLGPEQCQAENPKLVYGRMTGWGQTGPLAPAAGHDINYIALSGALHAMSRDGQPPSPPLNLIGDYGGGAMLLATGILAALLESSRSGRGQIVDAAMTDGSAALMSLFHGLQAAGNWRAEPGTNMLDGGAHFYNSYACADGKFISIGPIEPQFYATLLQLCQIDDPAFTAQMNASQWPALKQKLANIFSTRSRDEWCALLEGSDACFAPVLDTREAAAHPHNVARQTFIELNGITQAAPAPRFSRTPSGTPGQPAAADEHRDAILREWIKESNAC